MVLTTPVLNLTRQDAFAAVDVLLQVLPSSVKTRGNYVVVKSIYSQLNCLSSLQLAAYVNLLLQSECLKLQIGGSSCKRDKTLAAAALALQQRLPVTVDSVDSLDTDWEAIASDSGQCGQFGHRIRSDCQ